MAADACVDAGLMLAELGRQVHELVAAKPSGVTLVRASTVDLGFEAGGDDLERALVALLTDDGVDSVLAVCAPAPRQSTNALVTAVASARAAAPDKALVACVFGPHPTTISPATGVADVPVFEFPDAAAYALGRVTQYARWRAAPEGEVVVPDGADPTAGRARVLEELAEHAARRGLVRPADSPRGPQGPDSPDRSDGLDEWLPAAAAIDVLVAAGLPVAPSRVVHDEATAEAAARELGYPVAVKAVRRVRQAKTEAGGMALDVHGEAELRATLSRMGGALREGLWPAVVQPMVDPGVDVAVMVTMSPLVGPVISLGAGGAATEVAPARLHVLPLTDLEARRFVGGSSLAPMLDERSRAHLEDLLLRVGALVEEAPEVVGLELNPVMVSSTGAQIVDARLRAAAVERDPVPPVRRIGGA